MDDAVCGCVWVWGCLQTDTVSFYVRIGYSVENTFRFWINFVALCQHVLTSMSNLKGVWQHGSCSVLLLRTQWTHTYRRDKHLSLASPDSTRFFTHITFSPFFSLQFSLLFPLSLPTRTHIHTHKHTSLSCDLQCAASLVKPRALCLSAGRGGRVEYSASLSVISSSLPTDAHTRWHTHIQSTVARGTHRDQKHSKTRLNWLGKLWTTPQVLWCFIALEYDRASHSVFVPKSWLNLFEKLAWT